MATYTTSCVTRTVPYTTLVPAYATYVTNLDIVTTVPGHITTFAYTTCPAYPSCYTSYTERTIPPSPATTRVYTTITSATYSPSVTYTYTTACSPDTCPSTTTVTVYSTVCPTTHIPHHTPAAHPTTTYLSKRSLSNDRAPVVVDVARALGIVVLLGLLIYYFLFKRAASKASRRLKLGESDRKENFSDQYGPMEAGPVHLYVQDGQ